MTAQHLATRGAWGSGCPGKQPAPPPAPLGNIQMEGRVRGQNGGAGAEEDTAVLPVGVTGMFQKQL